MSGMAEVLAAHADWTYLIARNAMACAGRNCHWSKPLSEDESSREAFHVHQAEMLTAAGFGPVKEAAAKALEDAADEGWVALLDHARSTRSVPGADYLRDWLRARAAAVRGEG